VYAAAWRAVDDKTCREVLLAAAHGSNFDVQKGAIAGLGNICAVAELRELQESTVLGKEAAEQLLPLGDLVGLRYYREHDYQGEIGFVSSFERIGFNYGRAKLLARPLGSFRTRDLIPVLAYPAPRLAMAAAVTLASRGAPAGWRYLAFVAAG